MIAPKNGPVSCRGKLPQNLHWRAAQDLHNNYKHEHRLATIGSNACQDRANSVRSIIAPRVEKMPGKDSGAADWFEAELADTLDEDYELELSEPALSMEIRKIY